MNDYYWKPIGKNGRSGTVYMQLHGTSPPKECNVICALELDTIACIIAISAQSNSCIMSTEYPEYENGGKRMANRKSELFLNE